MTDTSASRSAQPRRNVLQLIDVSGPGGAQQVFLDLCSRIDVERWQPTASVPEADWLSGKLRGAGVDCLTIRISRGPFDWRYLFEVARVVKRRRIDLIHAHLLGPALYGSIIGLLLRVPVVATFHGQVDIAPGERFRRAKFAIINRGCRRVVFVSDALRRFFLDGTQLNAKISAVVHNGVDFTAIDTDATPSLRAELGVPTDAVLIGAVGNVRPPKGYDVLLRVAALLSARSPRFRFVIVGVADDAALDARLRKMRDAMGLGDVVHFAGFRADAPGLMKQFDVYLMTSSLEGLSLSTIQALGAGVPTVATRCGGPEEIIVHERTGLLTDVGDEHALAASINRLTEEPRRAAEMAAAGRQDVRARFGIDRMIDAYERLYEDVVTQSAVQQRVPAVATRCGGPEEIIADERTDC